MKITQYTTIALFLFCLTTFAQPGTLDLTFNPNDLGQGISIGAEILDAKVQSDGKTIIVGNFTSYNSTSINRIARINIDGTLDLTFNSGTGPNTTIHTVLFQSDGKIIIGGDFTLFNGISRNKIARLNNDGSLDTTFNPGSGPTGGLTPTIMRSAIQNDGKIIVGGDFTLFNGISRNMIARLNNDGSIDTTFNPGTGFDESRSVFIKSISLQIDSKIIITGNFTSYNGISSKNIIRLNANGTIDTSFNIGTGANSSVITTSIQSDGKIIIGGDFTLFNGISRNKIARLNNDGSIDSSFNIGSGSNNLILSTTIQSDGKIIIGGRFTNYNGVTKNNIARLNSDGSLDNVFDAESGLQGNVGGGSDIYCISILNNGKILIVGDFTFVNNEWRNGIAILESTGVLSNINKGYGVQGGVVNVIKQYSSGKFIIGGTFRAYNGIRRRGIAMINNDGTLDLSFNDVSGITNGVSAVYDIEIVGDKIIIVGEFNSYNGLSANRIILLNSDGSKDNNFNIGTGPNSRINTITSIGNNKFLIGGNFTTYNGTSRNKIAKINYNGSLDIDFNPINVGSSGTINTIENLPNAINGRYIAGGNFTVNGINNIFLCGFNDTGRTDASGGAWSQIGETANVVLQDGSNWNYGTNLGFRQTNFFLTNEFISLSTNGPIYSMTKQSDGKIIIGGDFTTFNGTSTNYIARLNNDGTLDTTFNVGTGPNGIVRTTSIQSDGKIIIAGDFTSYNGSGKNRIVRINGGSTSAPTGNTNQTFCSSATITNLSATGSAIKWYPIATGGTALVNTTTLVNGTTYYASQTLNGIESTSRLAVTANITNTAAPTGNATQTFCSSATIADLTTTGTSVKWYSTSTGGTTLASSIALVNGTTYYASQTLNSCESTNRLAITANITNTAAPTGNATQTICSSATIANLTATGTTIKWYSVSTGGTALTSTTILANGSTYYASQTLYSCESTNRLAITANITNTAAPTGNATQTFCSSATIADLTGSGTSVKWYSTSTGGTTLASSIAIVNGTTYYASQTLNSCESSNRLAVTANITNTAAPTGNATQTLAFDSTVSNISVTGTAINWYSSATGGTSLTNSTILVNGGVYYASQTLNSCESSSRLMVTVTVSPLTLVHDNFTIQIKSETCAGKNNGEIIINAKQSYNYTATINNTSYPFTNNSLNLKDLPAGTYIVCIGITGKLFQQCYTLTIGKGGTLTGKVTGVSKNSFNVEITEGTAPFEVIINGSTKFNSNQSSFNIDVSQGDLITIKSSVSCEGIYSKTISELTASKLIAYPNPTKGMFEISVPSSLREVYLEIFTVNSNLIFKGTYPVVNQKIQLNLENLNKGVYIVKTYLDSPASLIIIKE